MARQIVSTSAAVIRVTGSDAASFLQGQCSADLTKTNNVHALWLNRKGRVLAHTLIIKEPDRSFLILCPHLSAADAIAVMSSNLIADDVTLTDETSQWKTGIVWGDAVPNFDSGIRFWPSARTSFESWEVLFPKDMSMEANESDISFIEKNRVESGIPSVPEDCGANEFPQECGIDDWVSYNKGCYLGQEVMARIQSMGSLRRSLRQISATEVLRGDIELKSPDTGKIVGTMKSFMGKTGLALVSIDCAEGTTLDSSIGPVLVGRLAKLPQYS
jgi:folate-binding protein YgfZ